MPHVEPYVVRVALTGGPCGGKSSALALLMKRATREGFDVYFAPETATVILNSGFQFPTDPAAPTYEHQLFAFQMGLMRMQLQNERAMTELAASTGRPSIIIFDRGLLDAKGYMTARLWDRVLSTLDPRGGEPGAHGPVTEDYLLGRYDGVVHLVTSADGAEKFYKWGKTVDDGGNAVFRRESPDEARALDKTMQKVWRNHPMHTVVTNTGYADFQGKLQAAASAILAVAHETHPQAWSKAQGRVGAGPADVEVSK